MPVNLDFLTGGKALHFSSKTSSSSSGTDQVIYICTFEKSLGYLFSMYQRCMYVMNAEGDNNKLSMCFPFM